MLSALGGAVGRSLVSEGSPRPGTGAWSTWMPSWCTNDDNPNSLQGHPDLSGSPPPFTLPGILSVLAWKYINKWLLVLKRKTEAKSNTLKIEMLVYTLATGMLNTHRSPAYTTLLRLNRTPTLSSHLEYGIYHALSIQSTIFCRFSAIEQ